MSKIPVNSQKYPLPGSSTSGSCIVEQSIRKIHDFLDTPWIEQENSFSINAVLFFLSSVFSLVELMDIPLLSKEAFPPHKFVPLTINLSEVPLFDRRNLS
jgi:hypothetical protein